MHSSLWAITFFCLFSQFVKFILYSIKCIGKKPSKFSYYLTTEKISTKAFAFGSRSKKSWLLNYILWDILLKVVFIFTPFPQFSSPWWNHVWIDRFIVVSIWSIEFMLVLLFINYGTGIIVNVLWPHPVQWHCIVIVCVCVFFLENSYLRICLLIFLKFIFLFIGSFREKEEGR